MAEDTNKTATAASPAGAAPPGTPLATDEIDLDTQDGADPAAAPSPPKPPQLADYDPDPVRDKLRGQIALFLIILLAATVIASFLHLYAAPWHTEKLVTVLQIVFGPITTLVGAATGYYFGANSGTKK